MTHESLNSVPTAETKKRITRRLLGFAALTITLLVAAAGCSPKAQGISTNAAIDMGPIPADICRINNIPVVLNVVRESDQAISLTYVRNNGDIVTKHYGRGFLGIGTKYVEAGQSYWTGGYCPQTP